MSATILKSNGEPYSQNLLEQFEIGISNWTLSTGRTYVKFQGKIFKWNEIKQKFICMEKTDPIDFCKRHNLFMYDKPVECWNAYELEDYVSEYLKKEENFGGDE